MVGEPGKILFFSSVPLLNKQETRKYSAYLYTIVCKSLQQSFLVIEFYFKFPHLKQCLKGFKPKGLNTKVLPLFISCTVFT